MKAEYIYLTFIFIILVTPTIIINILAYCTKNKDFIQYCKERNVVPIMTIGGLILYSLTCWLIYI